MIAKLWCPMTVGLAASIDSANRAEGRPLVGLFQATCEGVSPQQVYLGIWAVQSHSVGGCRYRYQ